jgi:hypothetical protein
VDRKCEFYQLLLLNCAAAPAAAAAAAQPLDKLERVELRKQAEQFVEPGFKLVMQVRR